MKKIVQYSYEDGGEIKMTNTPPFNPDFLLYQTVYKLRADVGYMLLNKQTGRMTKSCIISPYEMDNWEEISYRDMDDVY